MIFNGNVQENVKKHTSFFLAQMLERILTFWFSQVEKHGAQHAWIRDSSKTAYTLTMLESAKMTISHAKKKTEKSIIDGSLREYIMFKPMRRYVLEMHPFDTYHLSITIILTFPSSPSLFYSRCSAIRENVLTICDEDKEGKDTSLQPHRSASCIQVADVPMKVTRRRRRDSLIIYARKVPNALLAVKDIFVSKQCVLDDPNR